MMAHFNLDKLQVLLYFLPHEKTKLGKVRKKQQKKKKRKKRKKKESKKAR